MFVEITYAKGRCPLCGGNPTSIRQLDSANDLSVNKEKMTYNNFITYTTICERCSLLWYVRTYSWIDQHKEGYCTRRNYVDYVDYVAYEPMFKDMLACDIQHMMEEKHEQCDQQSHGQAK